MGKGPTLPVQVVYSPLRYFGWQRGIPQRGGYSVSIESCPSAGEETTLAAALDELGRLLEAWVEADWDEHEQRWVESSLGPIGDVVREAVEAGSLTALLAAAADRAEATVNAEEDPLPNRSDLPDSDLPKPEMFGYQGDGEMHVEVGPSAPTPGWALAWLRHIEECPDQWRVIGRIWARWEPKTRTWEPAGRGEPGTVEAWQLQRVRW